MSSFKGHLTKAHAYWRAHLDPSDGAIDMTCGNGHDTLVLAELVPTGWVIGIDLQKAAIEATRARCAPHAARVHLVQGCHSELGKLPLALGKRARLIVYNLGYLPGGDKNVTTRAEKTVQSLEAALGQLASDGAISVMCYPGHEEGLREEAAVLAWARALPSSIVEVTYHQWVNRPRSPSWLWIRGAK